MGNVFGEMGEIWAEIADESQTERQILFLKSQLKPGGCILDIACGTGRHTIPLCAAGFEMVGLDASPQLLRIAKQRYRAVDVVLGDMRFLPFKTASFTATVSMDTSFGYLPSEENDLQSLLEIRRVLRPEGEFILDVFNRENLVAKYLGKQSPTKLREYLHFFLLQERELCNGGICLRDRWVIREKSSGETRTFKHTVRLYGLRQLEHILVEAGFAVNEIYGGYEGQEFNNESSRLILKSKIDM